MATTTAAICGFLSSQIYSIINPEVNRNYLKDMILCLSTPYFCLIKPIRIKKFQNYIIHGIKYI